jgi:terminal uridylyltransferase
MTNITEIPTARYPIVRFSHNGINCDLSFGNHLGVKKAALIRYFCSLDPKVRELILVVKYWAKKRQINDPANYTLNSFVYTLLVIHFLQVGYLIVILNTLIKLSSVGILPPLQQENSKLEGDMQPSYALDNLGVKCTNTKSTGQLLLLFFKYYALEFDYTHQCISVRLGRGISR